MNLRTGRIRISKRLKGRLRLRVKRHMKVYLARRRAGDSYSKAVKLANRAERGKMSMREWRRHNGKLGSIARWKK